MIADALQAVIVCKNISQCVSVESIIRYAGPAQHMLLRDMLTCSRMARQIMSECDAMFRSDQVFPSKPICSPQGTASAMYLIHVKCDHNRPFNGVYVRNMWAVPAAAMMFVRATRRYHVARGEGGVGMIFPVPLLCEGGGRSSSDSIPGSGPDLALATSVGIG